MKELDEGRILMRSFLEQHGIGVRALHKSELVFEEALTNSIRHGFDDDEEHLIIVTVSVDVGEIVLVFDDDGRPFDPVGARDPPRPSSIEEAKPGGLGLLLVRRTAQAMSYDRTNGRNRTWIHIKSE